VEFCWYKSYVFRLDLPTIRVFFSLYSVFLVVIVVHGITFVPSHGLSVRTSEYPFTLPCRIICHLRFYCFSLRLIPQSNCIWEVSFRYHSTTAVSSLWNAFHLQIVGISRRSHVLSSWCQNTHNPSCRSQAEVYRRGFPPK